VLHLGSLVELMEVGKSEYNQTGLAGFLRPAVARGELLCIAECTPEQVPVIEREDPQLVDAFCRLKVEEPDVKATRDWFAQLVIGQTEAVDFVVDLLATVTAGVTRRNRPIAPLLFIGATGFGKTEMAKALAEFLFGSKNRLTRFDMSEYADPVAVGRLAGSAFAGEGLLTAKVREQPFCVLLLDEFEKAHPSFFDLLLQVLGEARLTDAGGRLADFRNAVIILTSNLGAASYQAGHPGFRKSDGDAR